MCGMLQVVLVSYFEHCAHDEHIPVCRTIREPRAGTWRSDWLWYTRVLYWAPKGPQQGVGAGWGRWTASYPCAQTCFLHLLTGVIPSVLTDRPPVSKGPAPRLLLGNLTQHTLPVSGSNSFRLCLLQSQHLKIGTYMSLLLFDHRVIRIIKTGERLFCYHGDVAIVSCLVRQ